MMVNFLARSQLRLVGSEGFLVEHFRKETRQICHCSSLHPMPPLLLLDQDFVTDGTHIDNVVMGNFSPHQIAALQQAKYTRAKN